MPLDLESRRGQWLGTAIRTFVLPSSGKATSLEIEFRDSDERLRVEIHPPQTDWEEPSSRIDLAVNIGQKRYQQITIFLYPIVRSQLLNRTKSD